MYIDERFRWPAMVKDVTNMVGSPLCYIHSDASINACTCRYGYM